MKRLFQLTLANGKPWNEWGSIRPGYWTSKHGAKEIRDTLNSDPDFSPNLKPVRVSPGPDHRKYRGK